MGPQVTGLHTVALIEYVDAGDLIGSQFHDQLLHDLRLMLPFRVGHVDNMEQQICVLQFLQCGLERLHQLVGQLADEANGIGHHHIQCIADRQQAAGGVQRVEQPVIGRDRSAGKLVQQGRFARIGIANDGHHRDLVLLPLLSLGGPDTAYLFQICPDLVDLLVDKTAVRFQLRLAGALRADGSLAAGAALTLQMAPHTDQPGQQIAVLGQLHLQAALLGFCPLSENIQDQAAAVQHLNAQQLRQHPLLGGGKVIVENDHGSTYIFNVKLHLRHLALPDEGARIRRGPVLENDAGILAAGGLHQSGQLVHTFLGGAVLPQNRGVQAHQYNFISNFFLFR